MIYRIFYKNLLFVISQYKYIFTYYLIAAKTNAKYLKSEWF